MLSQKNQLLSPHFLVIFFSLFCPNNKIQGMQQVTAEEIIATKKILKRHQAFASALLFAQNFMDRAISEEHAQNKVLALKALVDTHAITLKTPEAIAFKIQNGELFGFPNSNYNDYLDLADAALESEHQEINQIGHFIKAHADYDKAVRKYQSSYIDLMALLTSFNAAIETLHAAADQNFFFQQPLADIKNLGQLYIARHELIKNDPQFSHPASKEMDEQCIIFKKAIIDQYKRVYFNLFSDQYTTLITLQTKLIGNEKKVKQDYLCDILNPKNQLPFVLPQTPYSFLPQALLQAMPNTARARGDKSRQKKERHLSAFPLPAESQSVQSIENPQRSIQTPSVRITADDGSFVTQKNPYYVKIDDPKNKMFILLYKIRNAEIDKALLDTLPYTDYIKNIFHSPDEYLAKEERYKKIYEARNTVVIERIKRFKTFAMIADQYRGLGVEHRFIDKHRKTIDTITVLGRIVPYNKEYNTATECYFSWGFNPKTGVCYHRSASVNASSIDETIKTLAEKQRFEIDFPPLSGKKTFSII